MFALALALNNATCHTQIQVDFMYVCMNGLYLIVLTVLVLTNLDYTDHTCIWTY